MSCGETSGEDGRHRKGNKNCKESAAAEQKAEIIQNNPLKTAEGGTFN